MAHWRRSFACCCCEECSGQQGGWQILPRTAAVARCISQDLAGLLDESAQTLFMTELWRGLGLTMKIFFEPGLTINVGLGLRGGLQGTVGHAGCCL